jgi:hypothetical protein
MSLHWEGQIPFSTPRMKGESRDGGPSSLVRRIRILGSADSGIADLRLPHVPRTNESESPKRGIWRWRDVEGSESC